MITDYINPFLRPDGHEGNSTVGDRIEKVQKFTREECLYALQLEKFCKARCIGFLQVAVEKAISRRLKQIEGQEGNSHG